MSPSPCLLHLPKVSCLSVILLWFRSSHYVIPGFLQKLLSSSLLFQILHTIFKWFSTCYFPVHSVAQMFSLLCPCLSFQFSLLFWSVTGTLVGVHSLLVDNGLLCSDPLSMSLGLLCLMSSTPSHPQPPKFSPQFQIKTKSSMSKTFASKRFFFL